METGLKENTASRRKTGIYSGSFNPVHIGHLALANWLCEFTELDELWFLITPHNPLKEKEELMDDQLRYELVKNPSQVTLSSTPATSSFPSEAHLYHPDTPDIGSKLSGP